MLRFTIFNTKSKIKAIQCLVEALNYIYVSVDTSSDIITTAAICCPKLHFIITADGDYEKDFHSARCRKYSQNETDMETIKWLILATDGEILRHFDWVHLQEFLWEYMPEIFNGLQEPEKPWVNAQGQVCCLADFGCSGVILCTITDVLHKLWRELPSPAEPIDGYDDDWM